MTDDDTDIAGDLYALVTYLHVSANRDLIDAIGTAELSFSQLRLLERLRGGRYAPTVRQAAQLLHLTPQATSRVVATLVDRGLVRRIPDDDDYRARRVIITDRGERAIATLHAARQDEVALFVENLDASERRHLKAGLSKLLQREQIAAHRPAPAPA